MKYAVLVAALVALVALQGTQAMNLTKAQQRGIISEAKEKIAELKEAIERAINNAKSDLQGYLDDATVLADKTVESGKANMALEIEKALKEIASLREQANDLGQDIEDCIGESEETIKNLPILLLEELLSCVTDQLNEAITIIKDTVTAVESTIEAIKNCEQNLEDCDEKFFCVVDVIADVTKKVASLPFKVVKQVLKAKDFVTTIKSDLEICAVVKVAKVALEAGKIVADVVECVQNKN